MTPAQGYRVGIDVGGTFTDVMCVTPDGEVILDKTPTTPDDQSVGVMDGLSRVAATLKLPLNELCSRLDALVHGTTTADNIMIQMNGAPTGLLVTEGHRDEIEMRRVHKEEIWDPSYPPPIPIARRRCRIPIPERVDFEGQVLMPLEEEAVRAGTRRLRQLGVRSIAVVFLHSFTNPTHERRARELILEEYPEVEHISLSHEVMPRAPEFERTSTTLVNAYVAPAIASYVSRLTERLRTAGYGGQMLIMQSTGGVMPPEYVARKAVTLLGSGPTGGVMGAAVAAGNTDRDRAPDFVAVDMGGTSYDVCLVRNGQPEVKADWNWRYRYYIGLPMVDVQSVGAGGGSIASVRQGALLVGPESAGSQPGPACYGRGGIRATVTDADLILGYLPVEHFAGGRMALDVAAARQAIERDVATPLDLSVEQAAWGIERIVNANMANAVRMVLSTHGADPRRLVMIAYGGNGPVHAWAQAAELGIRRILVPKSAPAFSALGLLVADYLVDLVRAYVVPLSQVDVSRVNQLMADLLDEATKELAPANLSPEQLAFQLYAQMCYPGQNFDMSVPMVLGQPLTDVDLLDLAERFHGLHEASRGFAFRGQQPLLRGVRLAAGGQTPKPPTLAALGDVVDASTAKTGSRPVYFGAVSGDAGGDVGGTVGGEVGRDVGGDLRDLGGHLGEGFVDTPAYDGARLGPGATVTGPALIEEPFTVVVLAPGQQARLDQRGNYDIRAVR
ncbi:MAG TPA: hydantoinase/oxoprolinase family protein [Acidimicrobiales bacterium]|nr:hydantoinase/oxoprolinase family protein [Acidimicrobiales bacterium]